MDTLLHPLSGQTVNALGHYLTYVLSDLNNKLLLGSTPKGFHLGTRIVSILTGNDTILARGTTSGSLVSCKMSLETEGPYF